MWRHPKYYKELRRRNKETQQEPQRILDKPGRLVSNSDQAISLRTRDGECEHTPGSGQTKKATSSKSQASSNKHNQQATSSKQQANED